MGNSLFTFLIKPPFSEAHMDIKDIYAARCFGRQHRMQVRAARKPAVILRETRQIRRAAARAKAKGRAA